MELIDKFKNAIAIYNEVDHISNTIKNRHELSHIVEELSHYPRPILIIALIESVKKINRMKRRNNKEDILIEVQELINHVNYIARKIDMSLLEEQLNREVH